ncbi:MAG: CoA activase, partial [Armatimonadetes bacterium]|nr:CoA activase [Armatimonadota bacterium]
MHLGIDIGSVSVKLVLINKNLIILKSFYLPHQGQPYLTAFNLLKELNQEFILSEIKSTVVTGSGGELFSQILKLPKINEIIAQAISSNFLYPQVKTIIEIGGEDSKLIILEDSKGESNIQDFASNSICAAGTGSFLTEQAKRFGITIEEFSRLATASLNPPRIAGRCSVFAKSDMIHLQQKATPLEDIIAGLCYALARNFISTIAKGKKITSPIAFQGGVAGNQGIVKAFIDLLNISKENLIISKYHALTGALGCALESLKTKKENFLELKKLEEYLKEPPLEHSSFLSPLNEYNRTSISFHHPEISPRNKINAYLGVDVGSISTNLAILDENKNLLAKRYLMTAGKPLEAVKQGLKEIGEELKDKIEICGVCTTGSGRYLTADFIGADLIKNEITAQAKASVEIDPETDTIFEIGGQDSKYISLENGVIIDFEMNKACAAGTGSFLEEQAEKLGVNIKENFSKLAFQSNCPTCMGERCTVFIESDINYHKLKGIAKENLTAGLSYSIAYNYLNKVVGNRKIGERIFFQGGVAFNKAVVSAFEKITAKKINIPPHHEVTGAIGCALMAKEYMQDKKSKFKGFDLGEKKYQIKSFQCKSCPNTCKINQVNIEKEQPLFYGSRCEKYERRKIQNNLPDLFKEKEKLLWLEEDFKYILTFGIPKTLHFYEYFPFWYNLFKYLEIKTVLSDKTNKEIINSGLENTLAESCFPVKVAHGHFLNLIKKKPDFIFIPSIINLPKMHPNYKESVPCPYVQSIPYTLKAAFHEKSKEIKLLTPLIEFNYPEEMYKNLKNLLKKINLNPKKLNKAIK